MKDNPVKISVITSLYNCEAYLHGFFEAFLKIININEVELVIIHNDPSSVEKKIIQQRIRDLYHYQYITVQRENLYKSWNRAILKSSGKYLAMWNVDDVRDKDCLAEQAQYLDSHSNTAIVSGDYIKVFNYGDKKGVLKRDHVIKNKFTGITKFNNGCFLMWRREIHDEIGYFDEQFRVGGDWEFWMRITAKYKAGRIDKLLGYYLKAENQGISKTDAKVFTENYVIKVRYYRYFLINIYFMLFQYLKKKNIYIRKIQNFGQYNNLNCRVRPCLISIIASFFLFWVPGLERLLVRYKYTICRCLVISGRK